MKHLTCILVILASLMLPMAATAQTQEEDRGYLQGLLEDNLSSAGRSVRIVGFEGALSSTATIEEMTIADDQGVWITVRGIVLDWKRSALLRGAVVVEEFSATEIDLDRLPVSTGPDTPAPEATPFVLPDLPVSINIGKIAAERVRLGPTVLGREVVVTLEGSAQLSGGEGEAALIAQGTEGTDIALNLAGRYANETRSLTLDLSVEEGADGLVATLIGLPQTPALSLTVQGDGPLDAFGAEIALETDNEPRLVGTVTLSRVEGDTPSETGHRFAAQLGGDIRPLLQPDYRDFVGADLSLDASGVSYEDGRLELTELDVQAQTISVQGSAALGPDQWPERFDLEARIRSEDGAPVLLAIPGDRTEVGSAQMRLQFDSAQSDVWQARISADRFARPDLTAEALVLAGDGTLRRGEGSVLGQVLGDLNLKIGGLGFSDEALAAAVGADLSGDVSFDYTEGNPLNLSAIRLNGADYMLNGDATVASVEGAVETDISGNIALSANDLGRFAPLAGQPLDGSAQLQIAGRVSAISRGFNLTANGTTTDLALGQDNFDRLFAGEAALSLSALRDEGGVTLNNFVIDANGTKLEASGTLATGDSAGQFSLVTANSGLIEPRLQGPARLSGTFKQTEDNWDFDVDGAGPGDATIAAKGRAETVNGALVALSGNGELQAGDLAAFAEIAGRPLAGAATLTVDGRFEPETQHFNVEANGTTRDLAIGQQNFDRLFAGPATLAVVARQDETGLTLESAKIDADGLRLDADGTLIDGNSAGRFTLIAPDASRLDGQLSGAARISGTVTQTGDDWVFDVNGEGPGAAQLSARGTAVTDELALVSVTAEGSAQVQDLSAYAQIAGRPIGGGVQLEGSGTYLASGDLNATASVVGQSLRTGIAEADKLLVGRSTFETTLRRESGTFVFDQLEIATPELTADLTGSLSSERSRLRFSAALRDIGLYAADFSGRATASGLISASGGPYTVDVSATGPGGIAADIDGQYDVANARANLTVRGNAPLGLVSSLAAPNLISGAVDFDIGINGPLALQSLSGRASLSSAQVVVPSAGLSITGISGAVNLGGGRANLDFNGNLSSGGRLRLGGAITLTPSYPADLALALNGLDLVKPGLYEAKADGNITMRGPLTGGALIAGELILNSVELRVADTGMGPSGSVFGLHHVNAPRDVRATLNRAGKEDAGAGGSSSGTASAGASYPLDLLIRAPARIFVRGRGLDAELGGELRLTGTTTNVVPQGEFDLVRGRFNILGKRLDITEASAQLLGDFDPYLRVVAETDSGDVTVRFIIEGLASEPEVTITSTPELPEEDILAQLLFGRDMSEISAFQALQIASAINTLVGRGGDGIMDRLRMGFGVDDLDVTTDEEGNAGLRLGKYISENIYTDVTVDASGDSEVNLNLTITPSITARGSVSSDGDTGLGIYFERDY
ncbi:translocation/assembly module TamB domain-containing protein [Primorskyibacter flagellatus]|uniref:translocation/assembly module TamB domain-containing protein n=1 Tax=Primorskyibacter flagellatus TaxID=1387277 RepID=UPI003A948C42